MSFIVLVVHVLAALGVIGLVLMQHGKGADMGAAFGGRVFGEFIWIERISEFFESSDRRVCDHFFYNEYESKFSSVRRNAVGRCDVWSNNYRPSSVIG